MSSRTFSDYLNSPYFAATIALTTIAGVQILFYIKKEEDRTKLEISELNEKIAKLVKTIDELREEKSELSKNKMSLESQNQRLRQSPSLESEISQIRLERDYFQKQFAFIQEINLDLARRLGQLQEELYWKERLPASFQL